MIEDMIRRAVLSIEPEAEIILYGSRARGDNRRDSDWDLLILVDGEADQQRTERIRHALHEISWDTGEVLTSIVRSKERWNCALYRSMPLRKNIELEGVRI